MPGPEDMLTPTPPADCALLIAMPLTLDEFESDLKMWPERGEYARSLASNTRCASDAWIRFGQAVAELGQDLISLANNIGVAVYPRATLSDINRAASDRKVLIILGHYKGPKLEAADLLVSPAVFCEFLQRAERTQPPAERAAPPE